MKEILKKISIRYKLFFDLSIFLFCCFAAIIFKIYKLLGVKNLRLSTKVIKKIGIFPLRDHYYEPQFKNDHLRSINEKQRKIDKIFNHKYSDFGILKKLKYSKELINLKLKIKSNNSGFVMDNPFFSAGDADFLYQFIRHTKPKRIIEVGSGYSTLIAYEAKLKNELEKQKCEMICIDPGKIEIISNLKIKRIKKKLEDCKIDIFKSLKKDDLLLIDSTHIIKPFGDVLRIYQEIIPDLNKNTNICIHDIFTPFSYPSDWMIDHNLFWNEQYLLETLLMDKTKYKIIAPLFFLKKRYFSLLKKICPYMSNKSGPSSFYLKKIK